MNETASLIQRFEERSPLPPLCPKEIWKPELSKAIEELSDQELTGKGDPSPLAAQATRSGLLLWNDDLYASHSISQQIPEAIGSYWHGIMHRREGDFSNAKHWFRMVGQYPLFEKLYEEGCNIYPSLKEWKQWDPNRFIDEVADVTANGEEDSSRGEQLKKLQVLEISMLLQDSLHK
ncbi:hypothetical protein [Aquibacillus albus]|uniref:Uncharacterized protein n=1 Tax=Aquibacillus albus TaxID=1168171 RepID=A0ABS2MY18_9BACI|nr:hypothetical protein [Aquibacillus albus]MBM7570782.1 hypothetical protein [Aquibacillus albus]